MIGFSYIIAKQKAQTSSPRIRLVTISFIFLIHFSAFANLNAESLIADESELRAAVVAGVLRFTQWVAPTNDHLLICSTGKPISEPVIAAIKGLAITAKLKLQHEYILESQKTIPPACNVLLVGPEISLVTEFTEDISATPGLLTICDGCGDLSAHTIISLVKRENSISFVVDLGRARANKLSFGSSMLELAVEVKQ